MDELEHYSFLNRDAEVLEFFEDLYAGFLQVVLQVYIFSIHMDKADNDLFCKYSRSTITITTTICLILQCLES